ncbi:hypothetical protein EXIGLDRAFT_693873 [Exidia glandulosa HHB12029]|uniref:Uncharacterized protein n=1 Tax=Exidia glandulosa HHB12029 TaxID=1314781 RepID=A0A165NRX1_EXIGL|nr:hypothetical protein EXIGLDRAFT_693873 [Exidia glandulosa HHB12029]
MSSNDSPGETAHILQSVHTPAEPDETTTLLTASDTHILEDDADLLLMDCMRATQLFLKTCRDGPLSVSEREERKTVLTKIFAAQLPPPGKGDATTRRDSRVGKECSVVGRKDWSKSCSLEYREYPDNLGHVYHCRIALPDQDGCRREYYWYKQLNGRIHFHDALTDEGWQIRIRPAGDQVSKCE